MSPPARPCTHNVPTPSGLGLRRAPLAPRRAPPAAPAAGVLRPAQRACGWRRKAPRAGGVRACGGGWGWQACRGRRPPAGSGLESAKGAVSPARHRASFSIARRATLAASWWAGRPRAQGARRGHPGQGWWLGGATPSHSAGPPPFTPASPRASANLAPLEVLGGACIFTWNVCEPLDIGHRLRIDWLAWRTIPRSRSTTTWWSSRAI